MGKAPSKEPHTIRIRVQSTLGAVVAGVGVLAGLLSLGYAFIALDAGNTWVANICAGLFLVLVMGFGAIARRLSDRVEITDAGIRKGGIFIAWHERPKVRFEKTIIQRVRVTMVRVKVATPTSAISFKLFKLPVIGTGERDGDRALQFLELIVSQGSAPIDPPP